MRVVRIGDVLDVFQFDSRPSKTEFDGMEWQLPRRKRNRSLAVLDVRKAFFFSGGQHDAVFHQARGRVVINGVDSQRVHSSLLN